MNQNTAAYGPLQRLRVLTDGIGEAAIAECLEIEQEDLRLLLEEQLEIDPDIESRLDRLCEVLESHVKEMSPEASVLAPEEHVIAIDLDGDGELDVELPGLGVVARSNVSWADGMERKRIALRSARAVAVMTQFRLGMDYQETVAALGLVTQIELALVSFFGESVPEPGMAWDAERRAREVDKRLARLRWVEREQAEEFSGLRGMLNALKGKRRVSGKELYQRMVDEADVMLDMMKTGNKRLDVMGEVFRYTGMDHFTETAIIDEYDDDTED